MFNVEIDWDKAHQDTAEVLVDGCNLVEVTEDNHWLRQHSLQGVMSGVSFKRKPEPAPVNANAPAFMAPPAPCATAAKQFVKLDKYQFEQLLATIKVHATDANVRDSAKLTHMQIHEKLLGLVEHD